MKKKYIPNPLSPPESLEERIRIGEQAESERVTDFKNRIDREDMEEQRHKEDRI